MFWEVFHPPVNWHSNGLCRCVSWWKRGGFYCYVALPSCKPQQILILQVATGIEIGIQKTKTVKPVPLRRRSLPDRSNILHLRWVVKICWKSSQLFLFQTLNVWCIYLHWPPKLPKSRQIYTIHWYTLSVWVWDPSNWQVVAGWVFDVG